jgi:hypothetical protein
MPVAGWAAVLQPTLFLAMLGSVSAGAGFRATGRHSSIAGMPGSHRSERAGNAQTVADKRRLVRLDLAIAMVDSLKEFRWQAEHGACIATALTMLDLTFCSLILPPLRNCLRIQLVELLDPSLREPGLVWQRSGARSGGVTQRF